MIEDKAINIVDMNLKYSQLVSFPLEASQNKADFMQSNLLPFGDATKSETRRCAGGIAETARCRRYS